ncbi:single-stranded DNA-binding protein [Candidatus Venteria ishoeyi]|uniref:Single-stranded DNA-binding protein n=1 Tax=Candidatus Venteria ishoeyi TaxID=1899563 RepID=A0A1H6F8Q9_9GAMM|nr:single-stranded DNA-binding protein [Candidatus Venteria ishoeyi]SEH06502.1 Single-stranded DNA-binding protein [Candidatus Venteria ishoeyi]
MSDLNKWLGIGRLGKDPELKTMPNGNTVVNFTMATSQKWKDKQSGEWQEKTQWHNLSAFGKLAEIIGQYLKKGSQVYIEGELQYRKYTDKNGNERWATDIIVKEMQMLGGKNDAAGNAPQAQPGGRDVTFDDDIGF